VCNGDYSCENFHIINCHIHDIYLDAIFIGRPIKMSIEYCIIEDIALDYIVGGDGIQIGPVKEFTLTHSTIDRRGSVGKFCVLLSMGEADSTAELSYNHFYSPESGSGGSALYFTPGTYNIHHNYFHGREHDGQPSLFLKNCNSVTLAYNVFDDIRGVSMIDSDYTKIYNNTFVSRINNHDGSEWTLLLCGVFEHAEVYNNIIVGDNLPQGAIWFNIGEEKVEYKNNVIENNIPISEWDTRYGFVDYENGNYDILPTSMLRDAGIEYDNAQSTDMNGNLIPDGIRDIGAYEYQSGVVNVPNPTTLVYPENGQVDVPII